MSMKKMVIIFDIVALALCLLIFRNAGAATTGILTLQGVVPSVLSIAINPQPVATSLDLTTTQTDLLVGTSTEISNSPTGYKIKISSLNSGNLKRSGGSETVTYSLKYGATLVNLVGSNVTPVVAKTVAVAGSYNTTEDIDISYTGVPSANLVSGTYSDTLTLEIEVN